jgi:hypothetical protein
MFLPTFIIIKSTLSGMKEKKINYSFDGHLFVP